LAQSKTLALWVSQKQTTSKVSKLTSQMHLSIINAYDIVVVPRKLSDQVKPGFYMWNSVLPAEHKTDTGAVTRLLV